MQNLCLFFCYRTTNCLTWRQQLQLCCRIAASLSRLSLHIATSTNCKRNICHPSLSLVDGDVTFNPFTGNPKIIAVSFTRRTSWRSWRHIQQAGGQRTLKTVKKVYIWHTRALPRYCSLQYLPPWRRDVSNRLPAPVTVPRQTWRHIAQSGRQGICKITKVTLH